MMLPPRITSACLATGGIKRPWRDRDFHFELAPMLPGGGQLDTDRMLRIDNYGEAAELVLSGMGLRMADEQGGRVKWVLPSALRISHEPWRHRGQPIDELWSQTLPPPPVTRAQVAQDMSEFLGHYTDLYLLIAGARGPSAAANLTEGYLSGLANAAYDSAFRAGNDRPLGEDQAQACERVLRLMQAVMPPADGDKSVRPFPALRRTLLSAALRWRLTHNDVSRMDLEATVPANLAMLANMSYQGARNALASKGISTLRSRLDSGAIRLWLQNRLGFPPLRECERPEAAATECAIATLGTMPMLQAFDVIRQSLPTSSEAKQLADIEQALYRANGHNQAEQARLWRCYARSMHLCIDSFAVSMGGMISRATGPLAMGVFDLSAYGQKMGLRITEGLGLVVVT